MSRWVSVTFNVQTLRREVRLLEICRAFRSAHFIGLQSTSDRTEPEEDSPVFTTKAYKFRVYRFPWRQGSLFPSKHSGIRDNTFLPANVRRIYTPPAQLAGRGGALKLVRGDAAFLIMSLYLPPSPSNLRENSAQKIGSGRARFWMSHLRVSCLCFCWTPMVTSPKLHGQSRLVSTAANKLHSTASAWENFCEIITCRRRTLTFPWSPTLRSTLRVFLLLVTFTDVAHCTTTEIDCNWQQHRGEGIIVPLCVYFNISSQMET